MKVTIELTEGVKYTYEKRLTEEMILLLDRDERKGHRTDIGKQFCKMASEAASRAMYVILRTIRKHGLIYEYYEKQSDGSYLRKHHIIKDINELEERKKKNKLPEKPRFRGKP